MTHTARVRRNETLEIVESNENGKAPPVSYSTRSILSGGKPTLAYTEPSGGYDPNFLLSDFKNKTRLFCCKTQQKYF